MNRAVRTKTKIVATTILLVAIIAGGCAWVYIAHKPAAPAAAASTQHQLAQISYPGRDGSDALALLKQHATVSTKHYSFGDLVVSINGVAGNGPKYWTFYINGKEASVGAGSYVTKNSDMLMWKLQ